MALSSVGTVGTLNTNTATAASFTWAPGAVGNAMFLEVWLPSTSNSITSISSTNATWTQVATFSGTTNANKVYLYQGVASSTSSATVSLVLAGSPGTNTIRSGRQEFHSSIGAAFLVIATSHLDSAGTNTWPTVAGSGLYFGWAYNSNSGVNGSTSGFTYQLDSNGNSLAYDTSATSSSAPVFGDSTQAIGIMAIITEAVSVKVGTFDEVSATSGVASSVTSISPPAGSMVRWCATWLNSNDTLGLTFTAADSHGTSYGSPTLVPTSGPGDGDGGCYLLIWDHVYSTAPGATTLTVTASGSGVAAAAPSAMLILPYTITGQSSSPEGAFNSFNEVGTSTTTYEISLTTTAVGSAVFVLGAPNHNGGATGPVTPITGTVTDVDWDNATVGSRGTLGRGTALTITPGATTFGWTSANPSPNGYGVMAAEVLPAGASSTVTSTGAITLNLAMSGTASVANPITTTGAVKLNLAMAGSGLTGVVSTGAVNLNLGMNGSALVANPVSSTGAMGLSLAMAAQAQIGGAISNGAMSLSLGMSGTGQVGSATSTGAMGLSLAMSGTGTVINPVASTGAMKLNLALAGTAGNLSPVSSTGAMGLNLAMAGSGLVLNPLSNTAFGVISQWNGAQWVPYQVGTPGVFPAAITTDQIASGTITAANIAANTITASQIAAGTITASQISSGIVLAGVVDSTTISAATIMGGTISGGTITGASVSGGTVSGATVTAGYTYGGGFEVLDGFGDVLGTWNSSGLSVTGISIGGATGTAALECSSIHTSGSAVFDGQVTIGGASGTAALEATSLHVSGNAEVDGTISASNYVSGQTVPGTYPLSTGGSVSNVTFADTINAIVQALQDAGIYS